VHGPLWRGLPSGVDIAFGAFPWGVEAEAKEGRHLSTPRCACACQLLDPPVNSSLWWALRLRVQILTPRRVSFCRSSSSAILKAFPSASSAAPTSVTSLFSGRSVKPKEPAFIGPTARRPTRLDRQHQAGDSKTQTAPSSTPGTAVCTHLDLVEAPSLDPKTAAIRDATLGLLPRHVAFPARSDDPEGQAAEVLQFGDIMTLLLTQR